MRLIDPILSELDREAATTRRVLERVPEDKLAWKPHERSMSLGALAMHLARVPGGIAAAVAQDGFELPANPTLPQPTSRSEILETFSSSLGSAKEILDRLDDATLMKPWSLSKAGKVLLTIPRLAVIRSILLNHSYHHRGQLSVYLRLLNVPVPSIYGASADENPFA